MNNNLIDFETNVFNICLEYDISIPEDIRRILLHQYVNSTHSIEITGKGFYDNIIISKECEKIPYDNFRFGCIYIEFENTEDALGMVVFVIDGCISLIEFYSYSEQWDCKITNYNIFLVRDNGVLSFLKKVNVSN